LLALESSRDHLAASQRQIAACRYYDSQHGPPEAVARFFDRMTRSMALTWATAD
jgi:hypothetical protein